MECLEEQKRQHEEEAGEEFKGGECGDGGHHDEPPEWLIRYFVDVVGLNPDDEED